MSAKSSLPSNTRDCRQQVSALSSSAEPFSSLRRRGPYRKSKSRRESILKAAFQVFAEQGYHSGTLQSIAESVGLSQGALLHHFPSKRHLLQAVLELRDSYAGPVPETAVDPKAPLRDIIRRQCAVNEEVAGLIALYTVLSGEAVTRDHPARPYFESRFRRSRQDFREAFDREDDAGRLRSGIDTDAASAGLVAMWDGLQLQWLLDPSVDVQSSLLSYLDLLLKPERAPEISPGCPPEHTVKGLR